MAKSVESAQHEFSTVRTGRASPALLDRIVVEYYGATMPLNQLSTISAPEARLITVQPYDKSAIAAIERAINESDLGLHPSNDGNVIRLAIPELTEERRGELVKVVQRARGGGPRSSAKHPPRDHERAARAQVEGGDLVRRRAPRRERAAEAHGRARLPRSTTPSRARKPRFSRSDGRRERGNGDGRLPAGTLCGDHHRRQRALGASAGAARRGGP